MSKTGRSNYRRGDREGRRRAKGERRIYVRTVRNQPPDVKLLGKAFLALALADAARMAQAESDSEVGDAKPDQAGVASEVRDDD
jgi:hypothetical protein